MPDDLRDECVDGFVVGDAGAGGVGEGDRSGAVGVEEAGDAEGAVVIEGDGVDEFVVDAAIDDADSLAAFSGSGEDLVVFDDKVSAFNQRDSHFAGEEGVLEEGGVVAAGGEDDGERIFAIVWCHKGQGVEEHLRVIADGPDGVAVEELREGSCEEVSVFDDVGDSAGAAAVVFQDKEVASVVSDEIGSADVGKDLAGRDDAPEFPSVFLSGENQLPGNDALLQDFLLTVDVEEETVDGGDALGEASFEVIPLGGGDDARHEVEGEDSFAALGFAVDVKGDSLVQE